VAINSEDRMMTSLEVPLQDPTITHQLFKLITEMSEDQKRILLKVLKKGGLKGKCRREHSRKPVQMPVRYTCKDGLSSGVILDISLGGTFISSRGTHSPGHRISMSFSSADFERTVWIRGDVMRVTPEGIGVRFLSMNEIQKTAVTAIASRQ
jgi:hypothetical protein